MSLDFRIVMLGSAPSLSAGVDGVIRRVVELGVKLDSPLTCLHKGTRQQVEPYAPGWAETVDPWPRVSFGLYQPGPGVGVHFKKLREGTFQVSLSTSWRLLGNVFKEGLLEQILYAPLLQIALAMNVRVAAGDVELEVMPDTDNDVLRELGLLPGQKGAASLGIVRQDPGARTPGAPYTVTSRREGYWLLESASYRRILSE